MTTEEQVLLIDKIKELNTIETKAANEKWESLNKLSKAVESEFQIEWDVLTSVSPKFNLSMNNSNNWSPVIAFYGIGWDIRIKNSMWVREKEYNDNYYAVRIPVETQTELKLPDFEQVISFIKKYNEEHLIKIQIIESNYLMQPACRPGSILDCNDVEQCEVDPIEWIDTGIIPQACSDTEDRYFVFRRSNGKVAIYYSVNGCGFGCDRFIQPGNYEGLQNFLHFLEENNAATKPMLSRIEDITIKSWK